MTHSRTLIGTITQKANDSYTGNNHDKIDFDGNGIAQAGFLRWQEHWIETAKKWQQECQNEGLSETIMALEKVIRFFERRVS